MSKERCSLHKGKGEGTALHNQHLHIESEERDVSIYVFDKLDDDEKQNYNIIKSPKSKDAGVYLISFKDDMIKDDTDYLTPFEHNFYERRYRKSLDIQNAKHKASRHLNRVKTMKEFYETRRYSPTEEILQWGNVYTPEEDLPDKETYNKMVEEYIIWLNDWSNDNGGHLHILNCTNHFEEATPHTQLRYIWDWTDENGVTWCEQDKAMELAGLELPKPEESKGQHNNRNMTFTSMCRTKWQDIVESYGFEVEREALDSTYHLSKPQFIRKQIAIQKAEQEVKEKALKEREAAINLKEQQLNDREGYIEFQEAELVTSENKLDEATKKLELDKQQFESYKVVENNRLKKEKELLKLKEQNLSKKGQKVVHTAEQKAAKIQNNDSKSVLDLWQ